RDRLPVARRREQRREGSAERPIPRRSRGGESLEPWRPGGARVGAEERVLLAAAVVGEQRVVPTQEGERQVAAADDAVARRLDEAPELVAETADDPAAERKGQGGIDERRLGDEALDGRQGIAAGAVGHAQLRYRRAAEDDERPGVVGNLQQEGPGLPREGGENVQRRAAESQRHDGHGAADATGRSLTGQGRERAKATECSR